MRPRIGLTCDYQHPQSGNGPPRLVLKTHYIDAVRNAGALPIPLPHCQQPDEIVQLLEAVDALLLTGGQDIDPKRYAQLLHPKTKLMHSRRDQSDFQIFAEAQRRKLPILAICLGCQIVNVARGGDLHQHLYDLPRPCNIDHGSTANPASHEVTIEPDSRLASLLGATHLQVNSTHHQAVAQVGTNLRPTAAAPDGMVEALEDPDYPFLIAVQWHPERLADEPEHQALFRALVHAASTNQR